MTTQEEKIRFVFDTKDKTSKELKNIVAGFVSLSAALAAVKKAGKFIFESTEYAARVETLGVVTETLGENAGYTAAQIHELERVVRDQGITTEASRQSLAKMMQAELDLANATDLARLAQDAAVIAGTDSSAAFENLINVISSGNVMMARNMGLQVDFNKAYKKLAKTLDKTVDELTAEEKATARVNAVLEEGTQIAGAYEDAMESTGKQLGSTKRYVDEFKRAVGDGFVPVLGEANLLLQDFLKTETNQIDAQVLLMRAHQDGLITWGEWVKMSNRARFSSEERAVVLGEVNVLLDEQVVKQDEANAAIRRAKDLPEINLANKLGIEEVNEGLDHAITAMKDFGQSAIAASVQAGVWNEITKDGIITDEERQLLIDASNVVGADIPEDLQFMIDTFNRTKGNVIDDIDEIMAHLQALTGQNWTVRVNVSQKGGAAKGPTRKATYTKNGYYSGHARGANFVVPPGYPHDSYGMRVQSGEHVQVTPAGQSPNADVVAAIKDLKDEMYRINQELVATHS